MHFIANVGYINYENGADVATNYATFSFMVHVTTYMLKQEYVHVDVLNISMFCIFCAKNKVLCFVYYMR